MFAILTPIRWAAIKNTSDKITNWTVFEHTTYDNKDDAEKRISDIEKQYPDIPFRLVEF